MIFLAGCDDKKKVIEEPSIPAKKVAITSEKKVQASIEQIAFTLPTCKEMHCPQIQIYRLMSSEPELNALVDDYIIKYVEHMVASLDFKTTKENLEQVIVKEPSPIDTLIKTEPVQAAAIKASSNVDKHQDFLDILQPNIDNFIQISEELSALGAKSQLNLYIKPQLVKVDDKVATVLIDASNYVGGAHGSTSQQYINFDVINRRSLNLESVIKREKIGKFNELVYGKFKNWIAEIDQTLDAKTYESLWPFKVSENFYLDKNQLVLQYGQYELGPYAAGLPRIILPYQELVDVLDPQYLPQKMIDNAAKKHPVTE